MIDYMTSYTNGFLYNQLQTTTATDNYNRLYTNGTCTNSTTTTDNWIQNYTFYAPVQQTPEEIEAERIKEEEQKIADEIARDLLLNFIDDDNKERFLNKKSIIIPSGLLEDVNYHIQPYKADKINVIKKDKIIDSICIMPTYTNGHGPFPNDDIILAKILHLKYNEEEAIMVANNAKNLQELLEMRI